MTRPSSSHIAHTSPRRGRDAATTRTRAPAGTARPIELPTVSIHNVPASARRRSRRVIVSGEVVPSDMSDRLAVWSKPHASSRPSGRSGHGARRPTTRRGGKRSTPCSRVAPSRPDRHSSACNSLGDRLSSPTALPICRTPASTCGSAATARRVGAFPASPRDVKATTSASVGRRPRAASVRSGTRPGPSIWRRRSAAASNTCWRTRSPSTAGTRCTRRRSVTANTCVVAVGGTGAGKSTLAYAASRHEWTVLSDDLTFVAGDGGDQLVAWGLPKPLNIPGDLMRGDDHGDDRAAPGRDPQRRTQARPGAPRTLADRGWPDG